MTYNDPPIPKAFEPAINPGTGFGGANRVTLPSGVVTYCQILNVSTTTDIQCRINNDTGCTFTLHHGVLQVWSEGDAIITAIDFANTPSGGTAVPVQIILSVKQG